MIRTIIKTNRYIIIALLIILFSAIKAGVIRGSEDYHINHDQYNAVESSALVNRNSVYPTEVVVKVTAYSSRETETDSTPFITASGTRVREGVVAANWLPIGTRIRMPDAFGDKIFTVEDRMHKRHSDKVDVWFQDTRDALRFGVQELRVEILL